LKSLSFNYTLLLLMCCPFSFPLFLGSSPSPDYSPVKVSSGIFPLNFDDPPDLVVSHLLTTHIFFALPPPFPFATISDIRFTKQRWRVALGFPTFGFPRCLLPITFSSLSEYGSSYIHCSSAPPRMAFHLSPYSPSRHRL